MQVSKEVLQDVSQHLLKAVDILSSFGQCIEKDAETKGQELTKAIIKELKKGNEILTDYLSQFPDE